MCIGGGWLDLKWCNELYHGSVVTVNIKYHSGLSSTDIIIKYNRIIVYFKKVNSTLLTDVDLFDYYLYNHINDSIYIFKSFNYRLHTYIYSTISYTV